MNLKTYNFNDELEIRYVGPDITSGPMPLILYFSIRAQESLTLDPYNQPVHFVEGNDLRVFSITLPGHFEGQDKFKAMKYWSEHLDELDSFIQKSHSFISHLVDKKITEDQKIATMGLSRGGLIATHLLAHQNISASLSFAPVTDLKALLEFDHPKPENFISKLSLENQMEHLYAKKIRYYIGNRDLRVGTKSAFHWVESLANYAYDQRVRSPQIELFIVPSTGQFGHGTLPHTFEEGAKWLKKQIVK